MNKIGKVTIFCGGRSSRKTFQSYLDMQKYAIENGFEKVKVEFVNPNDNKLQELIEYLKKEQERLARECSFIYKDSLGKERLVSEDIYDEVSKILSKIEKR